MRLLLVIVSLLIIQLAFGQGYHPLPTSSNYYWLQHSICNNFRYVIRYEKDTVIHTKNYNVYSQRDIAPSPSLCPAYITRGFIHQDTTQRRAYLYLPHKDSTVLLYDFKLNLHDSTVLYNVYLDKMVHLRVEKMENMKDTTGNPIKAYWTNDMNLYIESLGTLWGGLYGHNQMGAIQNSKPEELVCFGTINPFKIVTKGDALDNQVCAINSLKENGALPLSLYPTLAQTTVQFNLSQVSGAVEVYVYDLKGQIVMKQSIAMDNSTGVLPISILPVGIYQLRITNAQQVYTGRFIKGAE
jgi:hypothetical protein